MTTHNDVFGARATLESAYGPVTYFHLAALAKRGVQLDRLPYTVKILLENALRHLDGTLVTENELLALANWRPGRPGR